MLFLDAKMPRTSSLKRSCCRAASGRKKDTTFIVSRKQQYSRKVTLNGTPNNTGVVPLYSRMPAIQF